MKNLNQFLSFALGILMLGSVSAKAGVPAPEKFIHLDPRFVEISLDRRGSRDLNQLFLQIFYAEQFAIQIF